MDELLKYLDAEHGRRVRLALALGITPGAVSQWDRVPIERAADVEKATGISKHILRPDIFGSETEAA